MGNFIELGRERIRLEGVCDFVFSRSDRQVISFGADCKALIQKSHDHLIHLYEKNAPIYGVTTGFGDSCFRIISTDKGEELQKNLINYLTCATGQNMPEKSSKAIALIRLISLSKGYSGVSIELIERLREYVENGWNPVIPREGSLGASGDLIPLAYLGQVLQGEGLVHFNGKEIDIAELLCGHKLKPYKLKPKEGLSLVNGTSAMAGLGLVNWNSASFLTELATLCSSWLCMAINGRVEAFGDLVNTKAKHFSGQSSIAKTIQRYLQEEDYSTEGYFDIKIRNRETVGFVQDPYSLRCSPQILGPVQETLEMLAGWLENEINSASDNPLVGDDGSLATGGNFYGGYMTHGMDYLKISLGNIADHMDRQLTLLINDKTNRGLPANLANWNAMDEDERHLHHGLKGLHQLVNAITSEIMAKTIPNSIFSRSSESHNQDKVSLGLSGAVQCHELLESLYNVFGAYLICLAQAIDLRGIEFKGSTSKKMYALIRSRVGFIKGDMRLDRGLALIIADLKKLAEDEGTVD